MPEAEDNLNAICDYIAIDNAQASERFFFQVVDQANGLLEQPELGRVVPEYGRQELRERIFGNYRIVYRLKSQVIEILAVYRCSQRLPQNPPQ